MLSKNDLFWRKFCWKSRVLPKNQNFWKLCIANVMRFSSFIAIFHAFPVYRNALLLPIEMRKKGNIKDDSLCNIKIPIVFLMRFEEFYRHPFWKLCIANIMRFLSFIAIFHAFPVYRNALLLPIEMRKKGNIKDDSLCNIKISIVFLMNFEEFYRRPCFYWDLFISIVLFLRSGAFEKCVTLRYGHTIVLSTQ